MASEEDLMRQMMGFSGFGASKPSVNTTYEKKLSEAKRISEASSKTRSIVAYEDKSEDEEELIGPLPPVLDKTFGSCENEHHDNEIDFSKENVLQLQNEDADDDDEDEQEDNEIDPIDRVPQSHEIVLHHGSKTLSTVALDPSGSRLATGGHDYEVKFWDFNSMDVNLLPFRTLQPCESHWIQTLKYTSTGDMLLVAAGNAQPKVLDRDGHEVYACKKGDQYIVDMKNTKGHVSMVRSACWDPKNKDKFISCGEDSTIRLWDINQVSKNKDVIRFKNAQARKTVCTHCCFSYDGKLIYGCSQDGSIQAWDCRKMFVNTSLKNMTAHKSGNDITSLCLSCDNSTLVSRCNDDTVKLWDVRNFKRPAAVAANLASFYSTTNCIFSPDEKLILTGTSVNKDQGNGKLVFLERNTLKVLQMLEFEDVSVVSSLWHPKINQIVVGLSNGNCKVLFDPSRSNKGATLCVGKVKLKRYDPSESLFKPQIINPHSLRMYREKRTDSIKKIKAKQRADPVASHKPDAPLGLTHGTGGRLKEGMSLTGFVVKNIALAKRDDSNPREAILRHAKDAEENPFWIAPAYAKSQPEPIYKEESDSNSEDEEEGVFNSKRPKIK